MIYVSHATDFPFRTELYPAFGAGFVLPHRDGDQQYPVRQAIAEGRISAVLAEVSLPSTGQGIELGWASWAGLRIVCVHRVGCRASRSLAEVSQEIHAYDGFAELRVLIERMFPSAAVP